MSSKAMRATHGQSLEERIHRLRADIESIIAARVELVAKESPGVPIAVIRGLLTARAPTCACAQYLELTGERGEAREGILTE